MFIILADTDAQYRQSIKTLLDDEPDFCLVGEAADTDSLFRLAENHQVDLVLVNRKLPGANIEETIANLCALEPPPIVIIMSSEFEYCRMMLRAGADAFVSKTIQPDLLLDALEKYARQVRIKEGAARNERL
jgi:DNA-binding NarL/FixJ family response regulator